MSEDGKGQGGRGEVALTAGGLLSSALAIGIVYFGRVSWDFDISSLSFWVVIPAGAIIVGGLAASGYYLAAVWTGYRPSKTLLLNMVLIGASTFGVIQYLVYRTLTFEDGVHISSAVGFWQYYQIAIETQSLSIGTRGNIDAFQSGQVGGWGYALEAIQFIGFMLGGLAMWGFLSEKPYCEACSRYLKCKPLAHSSKDDPGVETYLAEHGLELPRVGDHIARVLGSKPMSGIRLDLETCPGCGRKQLGLFAISGDTPLRAAHYDATGFDV